MLLTQSSDSLVKGFNHSHLGKTTSLNCWGPLFFTIKALWPLVEECQKQPSLKLPWLGFEGEWEAGEQQGRNGMGKEEKKNDVDFGLRGSYITFLVIILKNLSSKTNRVNQLDSHLSFIDFHFESLKLFLFYFKSLKLSFTSSYHAINFGRNYDMIS